MDAKETDRIQPVKKMNFPHTFIIIRGCQEFCVFRLTNRI